MSLLRRTDQAVPPHPAEAQLAALTGRVDQAVARLDEALANRHRLSADGLVDVLLEVRHSLTGKPQEVGG